MKAPATPSRLHARNTASPDSPLIGSVTVVESVGEHLEDFRRIVLRGANVAAYKFALAKSIWPGACTPSASRRRPSRRRWV